MDTTERDPMPPEQVALLARLLTYPADRYPVQHAATQFQLGSLLLRAGRPDRIEPALAALRSAVALFGQAGLPVEHAKATVMLGIALRTVRRFAPAATAFAAAAEELAAQGQPAEQAAACYNLGLVRQDLGDGSRARTAWQRAEELFCQVGYLSQAAAAARDHGGSLLASGEWAAAVPILERAMALADRAADGAALAAAGNVLGLAQLAAGEPAAALDSFRRARTGFPRAQRPAEHAMVIANLALAYEQSGDLPRARLAARQALAVPGAVTAVRRQAAELLGRSPVPDHQDLLAVLDAAPVGRWAAPLSEEVLRWLDLSSGQRQGAVRAFLDGALARPPAAHDLVEALLQVLLELPPGPYELLIQAIAVGCGGRCKQDSDRLQGVLSSAMARFPIPQWQRLGARLTAASQALGTPAGWA